jgi:hypothetical protein
LLVVYTRMLGLSDLYLSWELKLALSFLLQSHFKIATIKMNILIYIVGLSRV